MDSGPGLPPPGRRPAQPGGGYLSAPALQDAVTRDGHVPGWPEAADGGDHEPGDRYGLPGRAGTVPPASQAAPARLPQAASDGTAGSP
jgi:hypothetical protein